MLFANDNGRNVAEAITAAVALISTLAALIGHHVSKRRNKRGPDRRQKHSDKKDH